MKKNTIQKNTIQSIVIVISFIIIIFGILIYHVLTPDKKQSILENRKLAQRPDFTVERFLSGEYSQRFDTYYSDQFPKRDFFIETNARINKDIFKQEIIKGVFIDADGFLLTPVEEKTQKDAKIIANKINNFAYDMADLNVDVFTAIVPDKSTVFESRFPKYYPSFGQKNLEMLFENLDPITNPIDSRKVLESHLDEEFMFYYTDHHWQSKAAFYAYQSIMSQIINELNLKDKIMDYNDYDWRLMGKDFYGSNARITTAMSEITPDRILVATLKGKYTPFEMKWGKKSRTGLYDYSFLKKEDLYTNRYQAYLGGDYALLTVFNSNQNNGLNTLVIKDSYANAFIQFLAPHYGEIHVMDLRHYKGIPVKEYVKEHNIDHIIILNNVNSIYVTPSLTDFDNPGKGDNQ